MNSLISVMLVDDEKFFLNDLRSLINWESYGFQIIATAYNGRQAYDRFVQLNPDIVITDIKLPFMDGLELCQKIREISKTTKLLLISSYAEFEYASKAFKLDIMDYLLKVEINEKILAEKLARVMGTLEKEKQLNLYKTNCLLDMIFSNNEMDINKIDTSEPIISKLLDKKYWGLFVEIDQPMNILFDNKDLHYIHIDEMDFKHYIGEINEQYRFMFYKISQYQYAFLYDEVFTTPDSFYAFCNYIRDKLKSSYDLSITFFTLPKPYSLNQIHFFFAKHGSCMSLKYILGVNTTYNLLDLIHRNNKSNILFNFERFDELLKQNNPSLIIEDIDDHLSYIIKYGNYYDLVSFFVGIVEIVKKNLCMMEYDFVGFEDNFHANDLLEINSVKLKIYEIIHRVVRYKTQCTAYSTIIAKAIVFIIQNLTSPDLSVEMISDNVGLSSSRLSVLFKKEIKTTIVDYINKMRVEQSIFYLKQNNYKIYEIANLVGYTSGQYFSRVFYHYTGFSPVEYREKCLRIS